MCMYAPTVRPVQHICGLSRKPIPRERPPRVEASILHQKVSLPLNGNHRDFLCFLVEPLGLIYTWQ